MSPLLSKLISIARGIGRWLLEHVVAHGAERLGHYLILRAETVFTARLARARTPRRKRWLRGRIVRWTAAGRWLLEHAARLSKALACEADALLAAGADVPRVARCERP